MLKTLEDNRAILKFNAEGVDPGIIWTEACVAGKTAVEEYVAKFGEPMYCGFGHVSIRPARGKFVNFLKKVGVGNLGYNGGYNVSYYDIMDDHPLSSTQSLDLLRCFRNTVWTPGALGEQTNGNQSKNWH